MVRAAPLGLSMDDRARSFLESHRVGHLATADADGCPSVVPICYTLHEGSLFTAIDEKPKRGKNLKRLSNIQANPQVAVIVDEYSEDWSRLAYVLIRGRAEILEPDGPRAEEHARIVALLRSKYAPYRSMALESYPLIQILPASVRFWRASGDAP